jgi:hypothetical protein
MGAAENRAKDAAMAAHMKERGVTRTTGQCPWGCGTPVGLGGPRLIGHLTNCKGGGARRLFTLKRRSRATR